MKHRRLPLNINKQFLTVRVFPGSQWDRVHFFTAPVRSQSLVWAILDCNSRYEILDCITAMGWNEGFSLLRRRGCGLCSGRERWHTKGLLPFCHYLQCHMVPGWSVSIFAWKSPEFCRFLLLIMMLLPFVFLFLCCLHILFLLLPYVCLTRGSRGKRAAGRFHFSGSCN